MDQIYSLFVLSMLTLSGQLVGAVEFEPTLQNVTVELGNTAILPCVVKDLGTKSVMWKESSMDYPLSIGRMIFVNDNRFELLSKSGSQDWDLKIRNVTLADEGTYDCIVSTNPAISRAVHLHVISAPRIMSDQSTDQTVLAGGTLTLDCTSSGHPIPNISWHRVSNNMASTHKNVTSPRHSRQHLALYCCKGTRYEAIPGRHVIALNQLFSEIYVGEHVGDGAQYELTDIDPDMDGFYTCQVRNGHRQVKFRRFRVAVEFPPTLILHSPGDLNVPLGSDVSIQAECVSNPEPEVNIDGIDRLSNRGEYTIKNTENMHSLTITSVAEDEFGPFTFICRNRHGVQSGTVSLKHLEPPKIDMERSSQNQTISNGQSVSLSCYGEGKFSWYKSQDLDIDRSTEVPLGSGNTLRLQSVQPSDSGWYVCMTGNSAGYTTHRIFLKVYGAPVLDTQTLNITAKRGFSVTLPCTISNLGTFRVMWMSEYNIAITVDDMVVLPDSRYTLPRDYIKDWSLNIDNVNSDDEGVYRCVISSYPVIEKRINLIVLESPTIDEQMTSNDMAVSEGDDVVIRCYVHGNPTPEISWFRRVTYDNQIVSRETLQETGNLLRIPSITRESAGDYICLASNGIEPGASTTIAVEVLYAPEIQTMMKNVGQYLGRDTTLECTAEGSPVPDMMWYINGVAIPDNWKFSTTNYVEPMDKMVTSALMIRSMDLNDYTLYACEAVNVHGVSYHNITVFPLGAPVIERESSSKNIVVREGEEVDLMCFASGTPSPTMTWSKNNGQTEIGPGTLTLTNIQSRDQGTYVCTASNPIGSDTLDIKINVEYPPSVSVGDTVLEKSQGELVEARCTVHGHPEPSMSWRMENIGSMDPAVFNKVQVDDTTWTLILRIDSLSSNDFGIYRCEATNHWNNSYALLEIVEIKPTTTKSTTTPMATEMAKPTPTTTTTTTTVTSKMSETTEKSNSHNPAEEIKATTKSNPIMTEASVKGNPNSSCKNSFTFMSTLVYLILFVLFS